MGKKNVLIFQTSFAIAKGLNDLIPSLDLVYRSSQYLQNKELGLSWSLF